MAKQAGALLDEQNANLYNGSPMDKGRRRVIGIMAATLASPSHADDDDLFGPPRADKLIAAGMLWLKKVMEKIDYDGR